MRVFLVEWATLAVSFFNTILLLWLGLTVLLNSDRRTWGIWLAGGSLLLGGGFFVSHTAVFGLGLTYLGPGMFFWLLVGSIPAIVLPFAWYVVMLWYAGFWDGTRSDIHRRQRPWLLLTFAMLLLGLLILVILGDPLRHIYSLVRPKWLILSLSVGLVPLPVLAYPLYVLLCISLSLEALYRPGPTARVMGNLARRRAHPWLVASSFVLLLVSLIGAGIMTWIAVTPRGSIDYARYTVMAGTLTKFDLLISALVAVVILLLGQAIVSYEVFTGKTLPRRGLLRHWRRAVMLALGYSVIVSWSLEIQLRPIYSLLLSALLMTFFYALVSWRSYAERERMIEHLRPFVTSPRLFDRLLTGAAPTPPEMDALPAFHATCRDVLASRVAYLAAVGPLAPLVGPPLVYPEGAAVTLPPLAELTTLFVSPQTMFVPVEDGRYGQAQWAVPLWSERGLVGVLLLAEKRDGSFYTQEEIEIARAIGERLIDTQASAEMARRLMALQRQRLAESQVIDRQTRRVLHDDVLPLLHTAMLQMNNGQKAGNVSEAVHLLTAAHRQISDLLHEIPATAATDVTRLGLMGALERVLTNELGGAFDTVRWDIEAEASHQVANISPLTTEVLFYAAREAIRNAARHGRGHGRSDAHPLHLQIIARCNQGLQIAIEDNGIGVNALTRDPDQKSVGHEGAGHEGAGQGLALHSTMMAVVGGSLSIESIPEQYTKVILTLPQTINQTLRVFENP
jgi:signal transduction histidine kinase